ncbi:MAG TPA: heavy metal translocating P-type ATPase [Aestuariivirgaceae bacterium]|nr:heavy metal translocating P-type ATPase [Aestuariivirgaceae bacterium]
MSCCAPGTDLPPKLDRAPSAGPSADELLLSSRRLGDGCREVELSVPGMHCGGCIAAIESALGKLPGVEARVNFSTRRVSVTWRGEKPPPVVEALSGAGYGAHLFDEAPSDKDEVLSELARALGVAGFAAANIMLLSVSVWSGAEAATRDFFHIVSALIAVPALAYSGRIFFRSALAALSHGRTNMDVPISLGVLTAFAMSLYETLNGGPHAYFDAAVTLLFFLLIGRTLDHMLRERARAAVKNLAQLSPRGAMVIRADGAHDYLPVGDIEPGMTLQLAAGERVPVDARVKAGESDLDGSLVTGESAPQRVTTGSRLPAGTLNLTGPLRIQALAAASNSFLAEMVRLMEAAEGGRARYRRIADRAARAYAPVVHIVALATLIGWVLVSGDWHKAILVAISVLIITCPCALGLAVPIVQVVAARRLFENGILVKDGTGLERLAEVDAVIFDKTGTLTDGAPQLVNRSDIDPAHLAIAAAMAAHSRHPMSNAIMAAAPPAATAEIAFDSVAEHPGFGVEACKDGQIWRLGRPGWAGSGADRCDTEIDRSGAVLSRRGLVLAEFQFDDRLRPGAAATIAGLRRAGLGFEIVSGDRQAAVAAIAARLGVETWAARVLPGGKIERICRLAGEGRKVLMVGDGLNDAPALVAAHASMAPASAADIGRNAADFVFLRPSLTAVTTALDISRRSTALIRQNFAIAIAYNVVAVPIAVLGYVTPLIAALAMSLSSIVVVGNAMRLRAIRADRALEQWRAPSAALEAVEG